MTTRRMIGTVAAIAVAFVLPIVGTQATQATARCVPRLRSVALAPSSVPGGATTRVTATLTCKSTSSQTVTLVGFRGVRVPTSLRVRAGRISASGAVTTNTRRATHRGWVIGTLGRTGQRALLTITRTPRTCKNPSLSSISLPSGTYAGTGPVVLHVALTCFSREPVRLSLTSTAGPAPAIPLSVPTSLTIGAYYRTAALTLTPKIDYNGDYTTKVVARYLGMVRSTTMAVHQGLALFENTPTSCSPNDVSLDLGFTGSLSASTTVALASSNPAITVPPTATFPQYSSGGGVVGVTVNPVAVTTPVTLSATYGGRTLTTTVILQRPWQDGDKITLIPDSQPIYGASGNYEVFVNVDHSAPTGTNGGLSGTATTDHPDDVQFLPNPVVISPGCNNTEISFSVPYETKAVHATITLTIGSSTATTSVTIEPDIASVVIPDNITGGQSATGTVTLAGAPDQPDTVYLQSSWGILYVPTFVVVPAGQTSATFPITTVPVTDPGQVDVIASHLVGDIQADWLESNSTNVNP